MVANHNPSTLLAQARHRCTAFGFTANSNWMTCSSLRTIHALLHGLQWDCWLNSQLRLHLRRRSRLSAHVRVCTRLHHDLLRSDAVTSCPFSGLQAAEYRYKLEGVCGSLQHVARALRFHLLAVCSRQPQLSPTEWSFHRGDNYTSSSSNRPAPVLAFVQAAA